MKIDIVEREGYSNRIVDWKIYVRKNLTVAKASEYYYEFIEENSFRPVSELVLLEDGELLKEAVAADSLAPLELVTVLSNLRNSTRNVYLRMEQSEQTEDGIPLYQITLSDLHDLESRTVQQEQSILKYRHFMTLEDVYYFEYLIDSDHITVYKYVNERSMNQFEGSLKDLIRMVENAHTDSNIARMEEHLRAFCAHLRNGEDSFEMKFNGQDEDERRWTVRASRIPKNRNMLAGIIDSDQNREQEAYYLTPGSQGCRNGSAE